MSGAYRGERRGDAQVCKFFTENLFCPVGTQCPYLHAAQGGYKAPARATRQPRPLSSDSQSESGAQGKGTANNLNNYKTKICRHYQVGKCKLGNLCNFAHGDVDLRESRHADSVLHSNADSSQLGAPQGDVYERALLLENRMDATFNTQRQLLAQLKALSAPQQQGEARHARGAAIDEVLHKLGASLALYGGEVRALREALAEQRAEEPRAPQPRAPGSEDDVSRASLSPEELRNRKLQLIFIIKNLQEVHKGHIGHLTCILEAQNSLLRDDVHEAAAALQRILYDERADEPTQQLHNYIVGEARKVLYNDIM